jgi:tetratricopeptide (TPR) repeat protein
LAAAAVGLRRGRRAAAASITRFATADAAVTVGVAGTIVALAFYAQGGVAIGPMTWTEIVLIVAGAGLCAFAIAAPSRVERVAPAHGVRTVALFAAFVAFSAVSVIWSLAPSDTWLDANRLLAYLAVFAASLALARLLPGRWPSLLAGIALASVIVCGWALLTKVFPEAFGETELFARLRPPFGYWNAVGLMAALGVPPLLWLAARRTGHAALGALAYPALGLLLVCLMLSYSRGALVALLVGLVLWLAIVPLRLRAAAALLASGVAAGLVTAWAFAQDGLTKDRLELFVRSDAGHELGLLLALMMLLLLVVGLAVGFAAAYYPPSETMREQAGRGVLGLVGVGLLAGLLALALAPGGVDGQVSKAWKNLTDPAARTPTNSPDRLAATASVRARYWREALKVHADSPLIGSGAAAYGTARKRYRTGEVDVQHAHGWVVQTLADLGWIGLLLSLAAAAAWLGAAAGVLGLRRRDRGLPWDAERVGMVTLGTVVLVFALHQLIDWTWYAPAPSVLFLLAAGWLIARPPLRERLDEPVQQPSPWPLRAKLMAWRPHPLRWALACGVLAVALLASWTVAQPLRAVHAGDAAVARLEIKAFDAAREIAFIGTQRNPLSVEPLWELAAVEAATGRRAEAEAALAQAVELQPANALAWRRLGRYQLSVLAKPAEALSAFRAAYYLDPQSPEAASDFLEASRVITFAANPSSPPPPAGSPTVPATPPPPTGLPTPTPTP